MPGGPVIDLTHSAHAALRPVPISAVSLTDAFWRPRIAVNRTITIPSQLKQCEDTGRLDNFRRAAGTKDVPFQGIYFNDSDVYKWAEAAANSLAEHPDPQLDETLDAVIATVAAAQQPDGYMNTFFMFEKAPERFVNLKDKHEIYCAGHLIQAAVAHCRATGKRTFLNVARRLADRLYEAFGPNGRPAACGHEEAEMALVELFRETRDNRYLELARSMVEARGRRPGIFDNSSYHQDHEPFIGQKEFVGHAVRHLYYMCGAADVAAEMDLPEYRRALDTLWEDLALRKMYVTGGAGARHDMESFGESYELPNDRAYSETCAAIANVMWNWRMLNLSGDSKYADLMELALYNSVLSGIGLDGLHYFYENPLSDSGKHRRQEWFGCACCPPNIARLIASVPGYFYSVKADAAYVHLYAEGEATLDLPNGGAITLTQQTQYPWAGEIHIGVRLSDADAAELHLRIPDWCEDAIVTMDGAEHSAATGSYFKAHVQDGSHIDLLLPMPVERLCCHPHVEGNLGRVALKRGPLVYCIEQADHAENVRDIALPDDSDISFEFHEDMLGGLVTLHADAVAIPPPGDALYSRYAPGEELEAAPAELTAIPYYAWANREAGPMRVWIPTLPEL